MENQNKVPLDKRRRWILARLLDIPPVLFGLDSLPTTLSGQQENILDLFSAEKIDTGEYRAKLREYFKSLSGEFYKFIPDIKRRIDRLEGQAHYQGLHKDLQIPRLLCEYRALLAIILHEYQLFDLAIDSLTKAIFVAEREALYDVWAYTLRQRGVAYLDRGELTAGLIDFAAAQQDFDKAVADFAAIKQFQKQLSPRMLGLVHSAAGHAYAHVARDKQEFSSAIDLIDEGTKAIGIDEGDANIPATLDNSRHLLDRGEIFITSPITTLRSPSIARKHIEDALALMPEGLTLRQIEANVRLAESYFFEGQNPPTKLSYPDEFFTMAVGHAEATLELLQDTHSNQHISRLENLYKRLRESSYGKHTNVEQFHAALVKVQSAEYFN